MVQLTVIKPKPIGRWFIDGLPFNLQTQTHLKFVWLLLLFLAPVLTKAQPLISSVSPLKGSAGTTVTINGSGFNAVADDNIVYFGAVKAIVKTATSGSLTVTVPKGASLAPVSITTGRLTSMSRQLFIPTFATCASVTDPGVTTANDGVSPFQQMPLLSNSSSAYMLNATDIDGNGFADIVSFHKSGVSVFRNSSTGNDITFAAKYALTLPSGVASQQNYGGVVSDLDGDGKPDIVFVNHTGGRVVVFRNTSTSGYVSFSTATMFSGFSNASGVAAGDFDGDGKTDLAVISADNNTLTFLKNNTTVAGTISFTNPSISIATGGEPAAIITSDFDGDGKTDIAVTNKTGNSLIIYRNNTTAAFSFESSTHAVGNGPQGLAAGDLNGDGKPDLLVLNGVSNTLSILTNNSSTGNINILTGGAFAATPSDNFAGTVAIADFDGDSKPDALVGSTGSNIQILKNVSAGTAISFSTTKVAIATGGSTQPTAVAVGDFNNDGQPDLADANLTGPALDVYRNALGKVQIESLSRTTGVANQVINVNGSNLSCVTGLTVGGVSTPFTIISPFSLSFTTGTGNTGEVVLLTNGGQYIGPVFTFVTKPANLKYFSGDADSTIVYGTAAFTASPTLDDGGGGITYTITNIASTLQDPVVGISINSNTGQIGWSDELPVGTYTVTITAANSAGSTSSQAVIKVVPDAPRDFAYLHSSYTSFYGETKQTDAPAINWMGQKVWVAPKTPFRISSPATLPAGIAIDPVTGVISWGPNTPVGTHTLRVRAENDGGYIATTVELIIATQPPSGGAYATASKTIFYGETGNVAIAGINWHGSPGAYDVITPTPLPVGLNINTTSGVVSWTSATPVAVGEYPVEVRARNDAGASATTILFKLIVLAQKPSDIVYTPQPLDAYYGVADNSNIPSINWHGAEGNFVMEPAEDTGITIDPATGRISWTATVPVKKYLLKIKAINSVGESDVFEFELNIKPQAPTGLAYNNAEVIYGTTGNKVIPKTTTQWHGQTGLYTVYLISPSVAGITVNQTGEVLIDPGVPVGVYVITIRATNDGGYKSAKFTLTVKAKAPVFSYPSPVNSPYSKSDSTSIPVIDWGGDIGSFTNLTVTSQDALFSFSTLGNGRVIWDGSLLPAGTYTVTVTAANSGGATDASFVLNITAQAPSGLTYPSSPATSSFGVAGNSGLPTLKWNGGNSRTFEVVGALPAGFSFDNATGTISWPATQAIGVYAVTVRARSSAGVSNNAIFNVTVKAGAPSDFYYTNGGDVSMWGNAGTSDPPHIDWKGGNGTFAFYDPTGNIPTTIKVDPNTGVVSWPDNLAVKQYDFYVRATSSTGDVLTTQFKLTITAGPASGLKYLPDNATVVYGNTGTSVKPDIIWYGEEGSFTITEPDPKPAGITVEDKTGVIKWSDDVPVKTYTIKVWASNSIGGTTALFTLNVVAGPPTDLVYSQISETEQAGSDGNSVVPTVKWHGEKGNFEIVNRAAVPAGITIGNDGVIAWDETVLAGTYPVQVKAVNSKGSSNIVTVTIKLTIAKPTIVYNPNFKNIKFGEAAVSVEPVINWHGEIGDIGIANQSDIPAGITIDENGVLHFPATLPVGTEVSIYVTVSNAAGQNSAAYKIKVGVPPTDLVYSTVKYSVMRGTLGASVVPTVNWNGLKGQFVATGMPSGVTIDASPDGAPTGFGGRLTWNASVAAGSYKMTAYAENALGKSNDVIIDLEVLDLPTAKISGAGTICAGISQTLKVELTGAAPWSITYSDGTNPVTINGITSSPYSLVVTPAVTTIYTLEKVSDAAAENTSLDDADAKVTVTVSNAVIPLINNGNPVSTCNGASLVLTASGAGTGGAYLWSDGKTTTASITIAASGVYTVKATDNKGCTGTSAPVTVKLNTIPAPVLVKPATTLICEGSNLSLTASGATTYQWYRNNVAIAGETQAIYKATQEGSYTVTGFSEPGCSKAATTSVALTYAKTPVAAFSFNTWCKDVPVNFSNTSVDAAGDAEYTWHFGDGEQSTEKQPVHTFTTAGTVMIILEAKSKSCPDLKTTMPKTVTIETPAPPVTYEPVNALKNRASILNGRSLGDKYTWAPATGLSNTNTTNPSVTPVEEQKYTFAITTKAGCVTVDTQLVRIFSQAEIFVPKGFTPNNDGVNDRLFPIAVGINELHYFKVFNRWGSLMYETQQAGSASAGGGWDGTYKGKLQPMDAYTWIAEGLDIDGKLVKISGSTVLMR